MKQISWYLNRLKAMNVGEIYWRIQQKNLQKSEKRKYYTKNLPVYEVELEEKFKDLNAQVNRICVNWHNERYTLFKEQELLGAFPYDKNKYNWKAGFQTTNDWPVDQCSYDIAISQREDIGDIRTNWELNRHYQFTGMAKTFYITGDINVFIELKRLFYDWNEQNNFLHGVEWTSAMEIAIRINSWIYMYCFLKKAFQKYNLSNDVILEHISHGIIVMTDYVEKHKAQYSSANNHLIVEMYAVGMAGIIYAYKPWKDLAINILSEELPKQNYADGVNKEMSLHYQSFVMEAYGLLMLEMQHNGITIPQIWEEYLLHMSEFLCDCCGEYGETVVFGDNDEGKILDLYGGKFDYYRYVLDLMGIVLPRKYSQMENMHENLCWILKNEFYREVKKKECYCSPEVKCYKEGGYTLWRSKNKKVLIGIDHAELGYGDLAAHGHADALSFQMFIEGMPVFVDPGTFNYHVPKKYRNEFRATKNHNTVCVDNCNQAQILGPFLWGRKYQRDIAKLDDSENGISLKMRIKYNRITHIRNILIKELNGIEIQINDEVYAYNSKRINQIFIVGPDCILNGCEINVGNYRVELKSELNANLGKTLYSSGYNAMETVDKIVYSKSNNKASKNIINTVLIIKES